MKRIEISLALGLLVSIFLTSFTTFAQDCDELRQNVLRLHILANSDSAEDQQLKLCVRDKILAETSGIFADSASKESARSEASSQLDEIERIARAEILRQGYDYQVKAEIVNMFFNTRIYNGIRVPAGHYDAVRIRIGEAEGENWWCVLFPPMCIPAASEKQPVELQIEHLGEQPRLVPKLAILELLESARK